MPRDDRTPTAPGTLEVSITVPRSDFTLAVDAVLPLTGITAVFGPSGAGKTTLLRAIAGLTPATGRLVLDGRVLLDSGRRRLVPAHDRNVSVAFQDTRLFPHLTVAGNLRFARTRAERAGRHRHGHAEVIEAFALDDLLGRRPSTLSGGERQRVALARALLSAPRLLLLDEPLSALDTARKREIAPFIEGITERFGLPMLYVTHAIDEVARLADRVLVLAAGRVQALGDTGTILERLDLQPLTGRFEAGVVLEAQVLAQDEPLGLTRLQLEGQALVMPALAHLSPGEPVRLRVRARDVALATQRPTAISIRNILEGRLLSLVAEEASPFAEALVAVGRQRLRARITRAAVQDLGLSAGQGIYVLVKSVTFDGQAP